MPSEDSIKNLTSPVALDEFGRNFNVWKALVPIFMKGDEKLWPVIDGTKKLHVKVGTTDLTPDQVAANAEFVKLDLKARQVLFLSMSPGLITYLFHTNTSRISAKQVWDKVNAHFTPSTALRKGTAISRFMAFKFAKGKTVEQNLSTYKKLENGLTDTGIVIPKEVRCEVLLNALPGVWEPIRLAWAASKEDEKEPSKLAEIIQTEAHRIPPKDTVDDATAMFSQMRIGNRRQGNGRNPRRGGRPGYRQQGQRNSPQQYSGPRQNSGRNRREPRCYNCGKRGHYKNKCRQPRRNTGQSGPGPSRPRQSSTHVAELLLAYSKNTNPGQEKFLVDSGATHHMTNSKTWFTSFSRESEVREVRVGSNHRLLVAGQGDARMDVNVGERRVNLELKNVLLVPKIRKNLISVGQLTDAGYDVHIQKDELTIQKDEECIPVPKENGLYRLEVTESHPLEHRDSSEESEPDVRDEENENPPECYRAKAASNSDKVDGAVSLRSAHETLAHINKNAVKQFLQLQKIQFKDDLDQCKDCIMGKQTRVSDYSRPKAAKADSPGVVVADLCSPSIESIGGYKHFLLITDEFSKFRKVYFLKNKSETAGCIKLYVRFFENQMGRPIRRFHSDAGKEFKNKTVKRILDKIGAEQTFTAPYRPQMNGQAERSNRTIMDLVRSILIGAHLERKKFLWDECVHYCVAVLNDTTIHEDSGKTAYEIFYNKPPYLGKLRPFGEKCFVRNPKARMKKLDRRGLPARLVGFSRHGTGYRLWIPGTSRIIRSKDIKFMNPPLLNISSARLDSDDRKEKTDENAKYKDSKRLSEDKASERLPKRKASNKSNISKAEETLSEDEDGRTSPKSKGIEIGNEPHMTQSMTNKPKDTSSMFQAEARSRNHNGFRNEEYEDQYDIEASEQNFPNSYSEAMRSPDKVQWAAAIADELKAMTDMSVWEEADLPEDRKALDSRWIFRVKIDPQNNTKRYKARLVLRGFRQKEGVDFSVNKIFSPVARQEGVRAILSIAAEEKLYLHQFDVKTAFLNAELTDEIYMRPPEGSKCKPNKVLRLLRSLYGLKQSPYNFNKKLTKILIGKGLSQSKTDPCIFYRNGKDRLLVCVYVDDAICAGVTKELVLKFIDSLKQELDITSQPLSYFLGIQIEINKNHDVHIHQTKYVNEVLTRFDMLNCKPVQTPCDAGIYSLKSKGPNSQHQFRQLIGSIMYLATGCRPDIAFVTAYLSRYLDKCTQEHMELGKRVLRYLKSCPSLGITYKSDSPEKTVVFSDADHGSDPEDRKSTSGTLIMRNGGPIVWHTTKQSNIAVSSCESELYSASESLKAALWFKKLLGELGIHEKPNIQIDNQACLTLIKNPTFYRRTKHIELKFFFIRDHYDKGEIDVSFVPSEDQRADWLTKPLNKTVFLKQRALSGLEQWRETRM